MSSGILLFLDFFCSLVSDFTISPSSRFMVNVQLRAMIYFAPCVLVCPCPCHLTLFCGGFCGRPEYSVLWRPKAEGLCWLSLPRCRGRILQFTLTWNGSIFSNQRSNMVKLSEPIHGEAPCDKLQARHSSCAVPSSWHSAWSKQTLILLFHI